MTLHLLLLLLTSYYYYCYYYFYYYYYFLLTLSEMRMTRTPGSSLKEVSTASRCGMLM